MTSFPPKRENEPRLWMQGIHDSRTSTTLTCLDIIIATLDSFTLPQGKHLIIWNPTAVKIWSQILQIARTNTQFCHDAATYCLERDQYNTRIKGIVDTARQELTEIFSYNPSISIKLMSSYGARTNLTNTSDIDFGILGNSTDPTDPTFWSESKRLLTINGYEDCGMMHGYMVYKKIVNGIEIEAKVRDATKSASIVTLHDCLDALPVETQNCITYIKFLLQNNPSTYTKFKSLVYSAYYTMNRDEI